MNLYKEAKSKPKIVGKELTSSQSLPVMGRICQKVSGYISGESKMKADD